MSFPVAGIYLDNYSEFITATRNLLQRNAEPIYEQKGKNARNNVYDPNEVLSQATIQAITSKAGVVANYVEPTTW